MTASISPLLLSVSFRKTPHRFLPNHVNGSDIFLCLTQKKPSLIKSQPLVNIQSFLAAPFTAIRASSCSSSSSHGFIDSSEDEELLPCLEEKAVKFLFWVVIWFSISLAWFGVSKGANAAVDSVKASNFGLKIANFLRAFGWPDEAVVFALATLPVLELRGAIPVGYWMELQPITLTVLSVIGNMLPVSFILLCLKKFAAFLARTNQSASGFLDKLFENAKQKAGPVEEFQWLGLMLFVAVPFPGTGAWTGAIIASILDMPFWHAISANFLGVVLAGLLVNLLVNLGLKSATVTGIILFLMSTFMWSFLQNIKRSVSSSN